MYTGSQAWNTRTCSCYAVDLVAAAEQEGEQEELDYRREEAGGHVCMCGGGYVFIICCFGFVTCFFPYKLHTRARIHAHQFGARPVDACQVYAPATERVSGWAAD